MAYKNSSMLNNTVLVLAVHPDDETLGCGGTLLKHKKYGDTIHWLIGTETDNNQPFFNLRQQEIQTVSKLYDFDSVNYLGLKTTRVDEYSTNELIGKLSAIMNTIKPNIVYLPFQHDVHSDHRVLFNAAYACTKSFRYPFVKEVYMMETISETEFSPATKETVFTPNRFVDISDYFEKKLAIMKVFSSEINEFPFPRSVDNIEALARFRGATANCNYAESFQVLKLIA
jgi:LmbE family N-acetylglucosaminyl deacetylase